MRHVAHHLSVYSLNESLKIVLLRVLVLDRIHKRALRWRWRARNPCPLLKAIVVDLASRPRAVGKPNCAENILHISVPAVFNVQRIVKACQVALGVTFSQRNGLRHGAHVAHILDFCANGQLFDLIQKSFDFVVNVLHLRHCL